MQESVQNILTTIDYKAAFCTLQGMYGLTSKQAELYLDDLCRNNGNSLISVSERTSQIGEQWA